ncbi:MAG: hypothetical protein HOP19_22215 [Acidobacteria bacterium]|nr:hypothetical protein [Acidobacteriota bacterium]
MNSARFVSFKRMLWSFALLCLAHDLYAQTTQPEAQPQPSAFDLHQREAQSQNPSDVSFTIRLATEQKMFRQGEVIRLELGFASSSPKTYRMDAATYDRSGRLEMDQFHLEPDTGFSDPRGDNAGGSMGGLRSIPDLEEKPHLIVYELNEWFRFEQPGIYRLYLTSPRVSRKGQREETGTLPLTSNVVEFEIVKPEGGWAEQELQKALQQLDAKDGQTNRRAACRALRFLSTKAAVPEMVRRYNDEDQECSFEFYAGLISAPQRQWVIETMEAQLSAPTQAVSGGWLNLLTSLTAPSWRAPDPQDEEQARAHWQRYQETYQQLQMKYAGRLAQTVALKTGKARAVSLNTLLDLKWDKTALPDLASFFGELSLQQQRSLLENRWPQIGSAALLPVLRKVYQQRLSGKPEDGYERKDLTTQALRRIYALAPDEGRRLMLAAMKRPNPGVAFATLALLPDETLPELDQIFMENFERGEESEIHSALIERYASASLSAHVSTLMAEKVGQMACYQQDRLLAYVLRVNEASGMALIRQALTLRDDTHCYPNVLNGVAELHFAPELEKLALEFLNDADSEVVNGAVNMLGKYGSAAAAAPLWQKLEQWHQTWNGRARELEADPSDDEALRYQQALGPSLRRALGQASAWLSGPRELTRLKQFCVTRQEKEWVDGWLQAWSEKIPLRFAPAENEWGRAEVAHYEIHSLAALQQKLAQFPRGTVFQWQPYNEGQLEAAKEELFRTVQSFVKERGMQIVR